MLLKKGCVYGQGVYFATSATYSDRYSIEFQHNDSRAKKMILAKVLVGETSLGMSNMKVPPRKQNGEQYDTTCDPDRSIFVCYNDNQCYPDYVITYLL